MIQRKQSIWLLIATLLNSGVFLFDLYQTHSSLDKSQDIISSLKITDHYPTLILAVVMCLLPFITIFMFRNRKRQLNMLFVSLLSIISFIGMTLGRVNLIKSIPTPVSTNYGIGAVLPALAFIFVILAMVGIKSDERLVKSTDRLRD